MQRMTIALASASPRRRKLLEEAGYTVVVCAPHVDDAQLRRSNVSPQRWVMSMAYLKARSVAEMLRQNNEEARVDVIVSADTVCVVDQHVLGQPVDGDDAQRMLRSMCGRKHVTMTGVCLLDPTSRRRMLALDQASVHVGDLTEQQVAAYIDSGQWRGKAGAYNLQERVEAGWRIRCEGDPATVMGLPIRSLETWLRDFAPSSPSQSAKTAADREPA